MSVDPLNPTTQEDGQGTSIEKFKSPEDRDKAYLELEKFSHTQAQRLADLEKKLETFETMVPAQPAQDQRSFAEVYPSAQERDQRETELASRLLTKPTQVLKEHAEYIRQQTMREVQGYVSNLEAINRFKASNPDLSDHEEIVAMFVRRQPENLAPIERLKRAAPEARKYLSDIANKGRQQAPTLDPSVYVEAPASASTPAAPVAPAKEEDALSEMIRERAAWASKKRV